jgi:hypothetical protein
VEKLGRPAGTPHPPAGHRPRAPETALETITPQSHRWIRAQVQLTDEEWEFIEPCLPIGEHGPYEIPKAHGTSGTRCSACGRSRHSAGSSKQSLGSLTVTHPFHALVGQQLDILFVKRRGGTHWSTSARAVRAGV